MAEQCIVCLDQLRAVEPPPPPPLPGDGCSPEANSASASKPAAVDSAAVTGSGYSALSTATLAGGNGHNSGRNSDPVAGNGDAKGPHSDAQEKAVTNVNGSNDQNQIHDDDFVAVIQICKHVLHDACLREWTTKANSCPICRQSFHLVDVYNGLGGQLLHTYTVEDKKQIAEFDPQPWLDEAEVLDDEISTPCPVCNLADHEEVLLLCDGCDTPYHTHCIGLEGVPDGAWFCMECVDSLGDALPAPMRQPILGGSVLARGDSNQRSSAARSRNFFPRTRHTMRRARRRVRSDDWHGAWSQITGHVWDAIHIDLDHDEDEALEEFRRIERLHDQEHREFQRWQERLDIARRLGAQDIFERNIPGAILNHAARHPNPSPSSASSSRAIVAAVQQSQQERRAWGDFDRALECDSAAAATTSSRKRKARSHTASPIEPPREQERKLKRPRTRRIGAPAESLASSSRPPPLTAAPSTRASPLSAVAERTLVRRPFPAHTSLPSVASSKPSSSSPSRQPSRQGLAFTAPPQPAVSPPPAAHSSDNNSEAPSFLSSLLKEVEMGTPSDDNIRILFGDPPLPLADPASPAGSSPAASAYSSPRAMSTTPPPPQRNLRPSSPTSLSSHILPVYPPANYSPTRPPASSNGACASSSGENSDSESGANARLHARAENHSTSNANAQMNGDINNSTSQQQRPPNAPVLQQPRPRRTLDAAIVTRPLDLSPTRNTLPLELKESISSIVRSALKPHWNSSQLTADQYVAINRDVSRKLYEEVTNSSIVDTEVRRLWEQKANREVARAVAGLQV
ncbi:hypothetical protein SEPCBS119000_000460 [Sporothrix epigloea]|uniref:Phd and ring finger domain protein n=1 Tax=Sporothrix epigloea TaxID=1892477 RepID=A0ABP0D6A4_9PEZI